VRGLKHLLARVVVDYPGTQYLYPGELSIVSLEFLEFFI